MGYEGFVTLFMGMVIAIVDAAATCNKGLWSAFPGTRPCQRRVARCRPQVVRPYCLGRSSAMLQAWALTPSSCLGRDSGIGKLVTVRLQIVARVVMAVELALAGGILLVASAGPTNPRWLTVGAATMLGTDVVGGITWVWAARRRRGMERAAFVCVAGIFAVWTSAAVAWLVSLRHQGEIESLFVVQAGYTVATVLGAASLVLVYLHYRDHPSWEGPVDAGIVALSSIVLLWVLVMPEANTDHDGWLMRVGTAYLAVIGGLAVAVGGMVVWRGSAMHRWLRWALGGIAFLAVDIGLSMAAQPSGDHVGLRLVGMATGVIASACLTVAALCREWTDDQPALGNRGIHIPRSRVRRTLPAVAMLGAVAAVAFDDGVLGLMAITAVALVVIQVLGTLEFVERLLDERSRWAATDALTGAFNRRQLDADLPVLAARSQRAGDNLTVMLLDVDNFKTVNDLHGHVVGDAVLQAVAGAITGELRAGDVFFRIGGDEFMVLMPSTPPTAAIALADRIRAAVAGAMAVLLPNEAAVTVSIGVVEVAPDELSAPMVIESADVPLYAAKDLGGDCVVVIGRPERRSPQLERFGLGAGVGD